jgi:hypothetical protein
VALRPRLSPGVPFSRDIGVSYGPVQRLSRKFHRTQQATGPQQTGHLSEQVIHAERFGEIRYGSRQRWVVRLRKIVQVEDRHVWKFVSGARHHLGAGQAGHAVVGHYQIVRRLGARSSLRPANPSFYGGDFVAYLPKSELRKYRICGRRGRN